MQIHRRDVARVPNLDVTHLRAAVAQPAERVLERGPHLVVQQIAEVRARDGESQAANRRRGERTRRGAAEERVIDEIRVGNAGGQRADVIERAGQRHDAVGRHFAVCRFQPHGAACRRGDADRPAGVGTDRGQRHAGDDAGGGAAARSAGRPRLIVRIARGSERRVLARRAEGEFVEVGLADHDGAGPPQMDDDRRVMLGDMPGAHARRRRRGGAAHVDQILDRHRHAVQRAAIAPGGDLAIRLARLVARLVGHHENERVQPRVAGLDARQARVGGLERAHLAGAELSSEFFDGHREHA